MKKKGQYSKIVVAIIIILNATFSYKVLNVFEKTSTEPTTLVTCWFAFTTGELWLLTNIRKTKIKKGDNDDKDQLETETDK